MPRLPIPGQDSDTWGDVLNDFLSTTHNTDGTLKTTAITASGGYTKPATGIPSTDMDSSIQTSLGNANTALQPSIVTTKGDLLAATAVNTIGRQGIGTNGQVLTADSTQATGMKWATPVTVSNAMIFQGIWNSSTAYAIGSVVIRTGYGLYVCTSANTNQDPLATQFITNSLATNLWQANGTATNDGTTATLTTTSQTGSAGNIVYKTPISSPNLDVTFTMNVNSSGTPADGIGFGVYDSSYNSTTAIGGTSTNVGIIGRPAMLMVRFLTWSNNSVQVVSADNTGTVTNYGSVGFNPSGIHTWRVVFTPNGTSITATVYVDGNLILTQNGISTTMSNCYPVFGSGTGGYAENALLTSISINQIGASSSYWTKIATGV